MANFMAVAVGGASGVEMLAEEYYGVAPDIENLIELWDDTEIDFDVAYIQVYEDDKLLGKFIKKG